MASDKRVHLLSRRNAKETFIRWPSTLGGFHHPTFKGKKANTPTTPRRHNGIQQASISEGFAIPPSKDKGTCKVITPPRDNGIQHGMYNKTMRTFLHYQFAAPFCPPRRSPGIRVEPKQRIPLPGVLLAPRHHLRHGSVEVLHLRPVSRLHDPNELVDKVWVGSSTTVLDLAFDDTPDTIHELGTGPYGQCAAVWEFKVFSASTL